MCVEISAGSSNIKKSCVTRGADSGKIRFQLPTSTVLPTPPIGMSFVNIFLDFVVILYADNNHVIF